MPVKNQKSQLSKVLDQNEDDQKDKVEQLFGQLQWKYQVFQQYESIHPEVIKHLTESFDGNPLFILEQFQRMLTSGFIEIANK